MSERTNERVAWFNGKFVPESEVKVPFRDMSWLYGDGAFDMTRSFNGKAFRLQEHIDRFYRSLRYIGIDPGLKPQEMIQLSEEVLDRNKHLLAPGEDYWIGQRVSRGVKQVEGDNWDHYGPNVIIECLPLPFKQRAKHFRDGIEVIIPSIRRTPPDSLSPRAKMHNYLNVIMADREVKARNPEAWAILLDVHGNLAEGMGSNIFVIRDGVILTPQERFVLPGVSRQTAIELAQAEGIKVEQIDIDLFDAYVADEIFLTSTSLAICGVATLNGQKIGDGTVPGPITRRITEAYKKLVDCDFVEQYLKRL